jgi:flagellar operon protein
MSSVSDTKAGGVNSSGVGLLREVKSNAGNSKSSTALGASFSDALSLQVEKANKKVDVATPKTIEKPVIKFSNHAVERMNSRGIVFSPEQITKIEQGVQKAHQKGGKEALVLTDDSALIVSLKNNTVVTVMDKNALKENVFTNIDTTVFI